MIGGIIPGFHSWSKSYRQLPEGVGLSFPGMSCLIGCPIRKWSALESEAHKQENWLSRCITLKRTQDLGHARDLARIFLRLVMQLVLVLNLWCTSQMLELQTKACIFPTPPRGECREWLSILPKLKKTTSCSGIEKPIPIPNCHLKIFANISGPNSAFSGGTERDVWEKGKLLLPSWLWKRWSKVRIAFLKLA